MVGRGIGIPEENRPRSQEDQDFGEIVDRERSSRLNEDVSKRETKLSTQDWMLVSQSSVCDSGARSTSLQPYAVLFLETNHTVQTSALAKNRAREMKIDNPQFNLNLAISGK